VTAKRLPVSAAAYHVAAGARHACKCCGHSCRNYAITLSQTEAARFSFEFWRALVPNLPADVPIVVQESGQFLLGKKADGACVFLDDDNLCLIHKENGHQAKPMACQFFPMQAVQAPDGIHLSLNSGCRRLIEMTEADPLLEPAEGARLLSGVVGIATIESVLLLDADTAIDYAEFLAWQTRLANALLAAADAYDQLWANISAAANLLRPLFTEPVTDALNLYQSTEADLRRALASPQAAQSRKTLAQRALRWLPALTNAEASLNPPASISQTDQAAGVGLCLHVAGQFFGGRQAVYAGQLRWAWAGLLTALMAGIIGGEVLWQTGQYSTPGHALNDALADAMALFALSAQGAGYLPR
jgi:Fe-S-cluster containining protein